MLYFEKSLLDKEPKGIFMIGCMMLVVEWSVLKNNEQ